MFGILLWKNTSILFFYLGHELLNRVVEEMKYSESSFLNIPKRTSVVGNSDVEFN